MVRTTTSRPRKQVERHAKVMRLGDSLILWLTVDKNTTAYRMVPLPSEFGRAVRLQKADKGNGESEQYDVLLDGARSTCECLGFLKHGHCKHTAGLQAIITSGQLADALPEPELEPEQEETVVIEEAPPRPNYVHEPIPGREHDPIYGPMGDEDAFGFCAP